MSDTPVRSLDELRQEVQRIDAAIVALLADRLTVVREIGDVKRASGLPIADPAREAAVVAHIAAQARAAGLPEDDMRELFWRIMALSRRVQR